MLISLLHLLLKRPLGFFNQIITIVASKIPDLSREWKKYYGALEAFPSCKAAEYHKYVTLCVCLQSTPLSSDGFLDFEESFRRDLVQDLFLKSRI